MIFKYITDRFGADKTARVASFGTIQSRGVIDDVGRHLRLQWKGTPESNPWSLEKIDKIKAQFDADEEAAKEKYPELFYYYDGLMGTKVSQSVHPAGMVISPVSLPQNYGVFVKDNDLCLMMDMDAAHEVGVAKYDFLVLKTVQVIRDTCRLLNRPYPLTHEINWEDEDVWQSMTFSPVGLFQFESAYAFDSLKKLKPENIFDMSLVTACIRPSGASYRNKLLARRQNHNPSKIIDDLLEDNLGYLVYQEDVIKFLQLICGLSGSEADNIRRAIGRKDMERLQKALPQILEGYCSKSDKPRTEAEAEAHEFLQIINDASEYMFGYNHSIAYCLLGYLCAYFRHYHPLEFLTAFLNNAANDDDITNGTALAKRLGIRISPPRFGISKGGYACDAKTDVIAKGLSSIKGLGVKVADELYEYSVSCGNNSFMDILLNIFKETSLNAGQLTSLIKIDYFQNFGNQAELLRMFDIFEFFKRGNAKQLPRKNIDGTWLEPLIKSYSTWLNAKGQELQIYKLTDIVGLLHAIEDHIKSLNMSDLSVIVKAANSIDILGYMGYISAQESDRRKLYIKNIYPLRRKSDDKQFGYSFITQSLGSGKESRFTVFNPVYNKQPVQQGGIILLKSYSRDGSYFTLTDYQQILI